MTVTGEFGPLVDVGYQGTTVKAWRDRPLTLDAVLRRAAERWPHVTAVEGPSGTLTWAQLDRAVDAAVASLASTRAQPGRVVAVALGHDLQLFCVPFVASRMGVTALLLNTTLAAAQWAVQVARTRPAVLIADDANVDALDEAGRGRTVIPSEAALRLDGPVPRTRPSVDADEDRPLALIATSGTTGVPKVSIVTSRGLIHAGLAYVELLELVPGQERTYVCLPLYYIGPLSAQTTTMPLVGGTCVIPDDTRPQGALARMAAAGVTHLDAVPSWLQVLAREPAARGDAAGSGPAQWRTLIYGGAPMPRETATRLASRFPRLAMFDVWGLSETHGPATAYRYHPRTPPLPGTVGRAVAGVEVRTAADDGRAPAELLVRGANVTPGYHDDEATTAAVISRGWLRTGDVGTVGADGTVRLLDRAKDVILRGGANVFSVQVEQVLASAVAVAEAAVVGVPDALGGEAVAAAVVLVPGAQLDVLGLRRLVATQVGTHAVPRKITALPRLPRNATGKIDKARLRQELT